MALTLRKTRIPSAPYLEQKIAQISAIVNPTKDEIVLLAQYKKLFWQRMNGERLDTDIAASKA